MAQLATAKSERSPAARLARTRVRLLDAVVEALAECGYADTTTHEVARRSGLTRGAQLHHFSTKHQMVLAAVDHLTMRSSATEVVAALDALPEGEDRLRVALAILSELFVGQVPAAYVELWVASRTDPELADALRDADVVARDSVRSLFGDEILDRAGPEFDALLDTMLYALRGMALDARLGDEAELDARRELILGMAPYLEQALRAPEVTTSPAEPAGHHGEKKQ